MLDFSNPDHVIPALKASSKKQVLQEISRCAAKVTKCSEDNIFDVLLERERLGSTGIGKGIAIPHACLKGLDHVVVFFARLQSPIAFESLDGQDVDLIFLLLAPESEGRDHLQALSQISRALKSPDLCTKLRQTRTKEEAAGLLSGKINDQKPR